MATLNGTHVFSLVACLTSLALVAAINVESEANPFSSWCHAGTSLQCLGQLSSILPLSFSSRIKPTPAGVRPLDALVGNLTNDHTVTFFLLPTAIPPKVAVVEKEVKKDWNKWSNPNWDKSKAWNKTKQNQWCSAQFLKANEGLPVCPQNLCEVGLVETRWWRLTQDLKHPLDPSHRNMIVDEPNCIEGQGSPCYYLQHIQLSTNSAFLLNGTLSHLDARSRGIQSRRSSLGGFWDVISIDLGMHLLGGRYRRQSLSSIPLTVSYTSKATSSGPSRAIPASLTLCSWILAFLSAAGIFR